jgi:cell division initiation protein
MKITPLEIKSQEFGKSFRGYDAFEVDSFLDNLASEMEELLRENNLLKEKLKNLEEKLEEYKKIENSFQEMLLTTQKSTEEIKKNAEKEANLVMREAEVKAEKMLEETLHHLSELRREIADLSSLKKSYVLRLKSALKAQQQLLEETEKEDIPLTKLSFKRRVNLTEEEVNRVVEEFKKEDSLSQEETNQMEQ